MNGCADRMRKRHRGFLKLFMLAGMVSLIACALFLKPQTADTQDDSDNVVFLSKKNIGKISLKNETIWFRCELDHKYCGYQKWKIENKGGRVRYGLFIKFDFKSGDSYEHSTTQHEIILQQGSMLPISEELKFVRKEPKKYFRNEKSVEYDWKGKQITVTTGDAEKKQSRTIMVREDAVSNIASLYYILDKNKMMPGKTFSFYSFDTYFEKILLFNVFVSKEIKKGIFEIRGYMPTSYGTGVSDKMWVSPRTEKKPNGEIKRIETGALIYTNSTEAKAMDKPPKKKKKKK